MAIKPRPVLAICSLIALTVACQPTGTTVTPGQTPKPSAAPSMIPSATPQPTNTPSAPIATPTAALPTPTPSPSAQAAASIKGTVQDDLGTAVFALSVRLEDMTTGLTIADTTTDPLGAYRFDRVPQGGNVRVSVSGKGYGLRQAILGIPPGPDGAYTYAQDFTKNLAVTLKPEVFSLTGNPTLSAIGTKGELTFTFSAPVDKTSVSNAFAVQLDSTSSQTLATGTILPAGGVPAFATNTLLNAGDFDLSWPTPSQAIFKPLRSYPTVASGGQLRLRVLFNFNGQRLRDTVNQEARDTRLESNLDTPMGPFFAGSRPVPYISFSPVVAPGSGLRIINAVASFTAGVGGRVTLQFSQPLRRDLLNNIVMAGGSGGNMTSAPAAAGPISAAGAATNYEIQVNGGAFQPLGGLTGTRSEYDFNDTTLSTVTLIVPLQPAAVFTVGDSIKVRARATITDYVGNPITGGDAANTATTTVI